MHVISMSLIGKGCILSTAHTDSRHRKLGLVARKKVPKFTLTRMVIILPAYAAHNSAPGDASEISIE